MLDLLLLGLGALVFYKVFSESDASTKLERVSEDKLTRAFGSDWNILNNVFKNRAREIYINKDVYDPYFRHPLRRNGLLHIDEGRILFHGTSPSAANNIAREGADISLASKENAFGQGFYLTKNLDKALIYGNHVAAILIYPPLKVKTYTKDSIETPSTSPAFIQKLKNQGYEAIEVYSGTRVEGWWNNGIVKAHELCIFNETAVKNKCFLLAVGKF